MRRVRVSTPQRASQRTLRLPIRRCRSGIAAVVEPQLGARAACLIPRIAGFDSPIAASSLATVSIESHNTVIRCIGRHWS